MRKPSKKPASVEQPVECRSPLIDEAKPDPNIRLELEQRASYRFSRIANQHTRYLAEMFSSQFGLTVNTWKILSIVGRYAPISGVEASQHSNLEPTKVTRAVDRLVEQGFVFRRPDPEDRRRIVLTLSTKGKRAFAETERIRQRMEAKFLEPLSPTELETLYVALDKLDRRAMELFPRGAGTKSDNESELD
jgi:DNA-binding MarR family transcriptional regulator